MTISKLRVTCQKCGHVFDADVVTDAPITVAIASMKAVRCAKCGSDKCGLGGGYDDAPPLSASIEERAGWWKERGETGVSSKTIWAAFCGASAQDEDVPHDPDDFSRCRKLLLLIPEWRSDLGKLVARHPWYGPFVRRWDEFDAMFTKTESGKYRTKKAEYAAWGPLYDAMKLAEADSLRIRFPKAEIVTNERGHVSSMRSVAE